MHKKPVAGKKTASRVRRQPERQRPPRGRPTPAARGAAAEAGGIRPATRSIQELLASRSSLRQVAQLTATQPSWLQWLREQLPAELAAHVVSVVPKPAVPFSTSPATPSATPPAAAPAARPAGARHGQTARIIGELVVFADSPAWCLRLRYALSDLHGALRAREAALGTFTVRVGRPGSLA